MKYYVGNASYGQDDIFHDGSKGMHWGVRRYQNYDGTLTEEGKRRYAKKTINESLRSEYRSGLRLKDRQRFAKDIRKDTNVSKKLSEYNKRHNKTLRARDRSIDAFYKGDLSQSYDDFMKSKAGKKGVHGDYQKARRAEEKARANVVKATSSYVDSIVRNYGGRRAGKLDKAEYRQSYEQVQRWLSNAVMNPLPDKD